MTARSVLGTLLLVLVASSCTADTCSITDCGMNVTQLIQARGYPVEDWTVRTTDGFLLSVQHIPYGRNENLMRQRSNKPVVFLQHGLLDASHTWVLNSPEESLGFILADAGYDVWMGNSRGNTYSRRHVSLSPNQVEFWAWSWDEMAKYDLPAMIDFVLKQTGQSELLYVGHSQGTMQVFAALEQPYLQSKIKLFVALAPVAFVHHLSSFLLKVVASMHAEVLLEVFGNKDFLPSNQLLKQLLPEICKVREAICSDTMCALMGCNKANWNATRMQLYVQLDPAGTSVQNMAHFAQSVRSEVFAMFDYGRTGNEKHYGQATPPAYDLAKVAVPMAIFSGGKDEMADPTDVATIQQTVPSKYQLYSKLIPEYSHLDFVWGLDAHTKVYAEILQLFAKL